MDKTQSEELLGKVLADVSRAFYLSMRILPASCRPAVSLGYLLARAADTLADNSNRTPEERLKDLRTWKAIVAGGSGEEDRSRFWRDMRLYVRQAAEKSELPKGAAPSVPAGPEELDGEELKSCIEILERNGRAGRDTGITAGEGRLLLRLSEVYELFMSLDDFALGEVRDVVSTLISGMEWDLSYFPGIFTKNEELERYTYLVAGCVGRFWTHVTAHYLGAVKPEDMERAELLGVSFGKALQYTNILRDLPKDLRSGRCYIPCEVLAQFLPGGSPHRSLESCRVYLKPFVAAALEHFRKALEYIKMTPKRFILLRLSTIWPVAIGLGTFAAMGESRFWPAFGKRVKVSRRWVYAMILLSLLLVPSNTLLEAAFNYWEKRIENEFERDSEP